MIGILIIALTIFVLFILYRKRKKEKPEEIKPEEIKPAETPVRTCTGPVKEPVRSVRPSGPVYETLKIYSFWPDQGWECPMCGAVNTKSVPYCRVCLEKKREAVS